MSLKPTHVSLRHILDSAIRGMTRDEIASFRKPDGLSLRKVFELFEPTVRRPSGFTWVLSTRDVQPLLAYSGSLGGTQAIQSRVERQRMYHFKCLFSHRKVMPDTSASFAGPVMKLNSHFYFLAQHLLGRSNENPSGNNIFSSSIKKIGVYDDKNASEHGQQRTKNRVSLSMHTILMALKPANVDDFEQSVLEDQVELALLFNNHQAANTLGEFKTVTLLQRMLAACQDEYAPSILGDEHVPSKDYSSMYEELVSLFATTAMPNVPKIPVATSEIVLEAQTNADTEIAVEEAEAEAEESKSEGIDATANDARQILINFIENAKVQDHKSTNVHNNSGFQLACVGAVAGAAAATTARRICDELEAKHSGTGGIVEQFLDSMFGILQHVIKSKKNPIGQLRLMLQTKLERYPAALSNSVGGALLSYIKQYQRLPPNFESGDWSVKQCLAAVENSAHTSRGLLGDFNQLSRQKVSVDKYRSGKLSEKDFKSQLLNLEVCPVLAEVTVSLLQLNGPIVLPSTVLVVAKAFKNAHPLSPQTQELDNAVKAFYSSSGLPVASARLLRKFVKIFALGLDDKETGDFFTKPWTDIEHNAIQHGKWLATSILKSPLNIQRRSVRAGCFEDAPSRLRVAFVIEEQYYNKYLHKLALAFANSVTDPIISSDVCNSLVDRVTSFMAYTLRHYKALNESGYLGKPDIKTNTLNALDTDQTEKGVNIYDATSKFVEDDETQKTVAQMQRQEHGQEGMDYTISANSSLISSSSLLNENTSAIDNKVHKRSKFEACRLTQSERSLAADLAKNSYSHTSPRNFGTHRDENKKRWRFIKTVVSGVTLLYYPVIDKILKYLNHSLETLPIKQVSKVWFTGACPDEVTIMHGGACSIPSIQAACKRLENLCYELCLLIVADALVHCELCSENHSSY